MRKKRILSTVLVTCLVGSLVACSSGGNSSSDLKDTTSSTIPSAEDLVPSTEISGDTVSRGGVGDGEYKEAPILAQMVENGELPPIEERLPVEPSVVIVDEIGVYGGNYQGAAFGPTSGQLDTEALRYQSLLTIEKDLKTFTPNIIKDYTISDDFTEYTLILRDGMKWSNGDDLTADDFMFWYDEADTKDEWFSKLQTMGDKFGYARNGKELKANPEKYKGDISHVAKVFRILITGHPQSTDLYSIMQVMGKEKVFKRLGLLAC